MNKGKSARRKANRNGGKRNRWRSAEPRVALNHTGAGCDSTVELRAFGWVTQRAGVVCNQVALGRLTKNPSLVEKAVHFTVGHGNSRLRSSPEIAPGALAAIGLDDVDISGSLRGPTRALERNNDMRLPQ